MVLTTVSASFMRAKVSLGPPKHAAQEGGAGATQPAASKIWKAVLPSQPGTGKPYRSAHTCRGLKSELYCQGNARSLFGWWSLLCIAMRCNSLQG